ncbi:MAG: PAS domain-containing protein [Candidatus Coatesbacteria bacterium]
MPGPINLGSGALTPEQVDLVLRHLPGEITFVDEHDVTVYYSDPKHRLFSRTPDILGRSVQSCHKPETVPAVNRILEAFRAGTQDFFDFPAEKAGRKIHVRYVAVRDAAGSYRGCLEIAQPADALAPAPKD